MGFCRRCGEIVAGARCKCGGTAVAAVVPWNQSNSKEQRQDRWSKTYVSRDKSPTRTLSRGPSTVNTHTTGSTIVPTTTTAPPSPTKRFPRPVSTTSFSSPTPVLGNRISAHIASTTSQPTRPPSPLKQSTTLPVPESDILLSPSPHTSILTKVYGSVLQPKESLTTHSCSICSMPFSPDATIYPDPSAQNPSASRFLCRACFTMNGGSKGTCPTCSRPVLTLKADGGFVQVAGKFWHKRCFNCEGCFKNIGDSPLVDLLGRPSCAECFDECLKKDSNTPKKKWKSNSNSPQVDNIGGMSLSSSKGVKSREGSPAIEELEHRLGIVKSKEGSPALEDFGKGLSSINGKESPTRSSLTSKYSASGGSPIASPLSSRYSPASQESSHQSCRRSDTRMDGDSSPVRRYERFQSPGREQRDRESVASRPSPVMYTSTSPSLSPMQSNATGSPVTEDAIEVMKMRFLKGSSSSPAPISAKLDSSLSARIIAPRFSTSQTHVSKIPLPVSLSTSPLSPTIPNTPDLMSDFSDTTTQSSGPDSPPSDDGDVSVDVFNVGKVFGTGYGSRYTRGEFFDGPGDNGVIIEETASQMGTPTPTHKSKGLLGSTPAGTPTKTVSSVSPPPEGGIQSKPSKTLNPKPHVLTIPTAPPELSTSATCAKCNGALSALREEGRFVTVPADPESVDEKPQMYHPECFRCVVCQKMFKENGEGRAVFVRGEGGGCHVECVPSEKVNIRTICSSSSATSIFSNETPSPPAMPASTSTPSPALASTPIYTSSRYDPPPLTAPPTSTPTSFPRFGSMTACPGCHKSVSPMERGVVPGPQGSRWHAACLVCGGKKEVVKGWGIGRGRERRKKGEPGCGKKLDSAAKGDGEGGIWCRECLLLLPIGMRGSPQGSPTRSPLVPSYTGSVGGSGKVVPQFTGTTTLARQFTGLGGSDAALLRQLTGGGLSPTRQLGMMGGGGVGMKVRPKSVIGMRNTKSVDEGRGMFLVRQMTGAGTEQWL